VVGSDAFTDLRCFVIHARQIGVGVVDYSTFFSDLAYRCLCIVECRRAQPALLCDKPAAIVWLLTAETTPYSVHLATSPHTSRVTVHVYDLQLPINQPHHLQHHTYIQPTEMKKYTRPTTIPANHHSPVL
jgi:hypothetical protein